MQIKGQGIWARRSRHIGITRCGEMSILYSRHCISRTIFKRLIINQMTPELLWKLWHERNSVHFFFFIHTIFFTIRFFFKFLYFIALQVSSPQITNAIIIINSILNYEIYVNPLFNIVFFFVEFHNYYHLTVNISKYTNLHLIE